VTIGAHDTALEIEAKLAAACVPLLARALPKLAAGELVFNEQAHAAATFCRKLAKDDGTINFDESAATIAARINGLFPWPACSVEIAGQPVKIGLADIIDSSGAPGEVLGADDQGLCVAAGAGGVRFLRMQRPGGKMLVAGEFLRGFPVAAGTRLISRPMPALVSG
jgi:methionyl-tRNA formyltransferase